jgi:hypothetical protein
MAGIQGYDTKPQLKVIKGPRNRIKLYGKK